VVAGVAGIATQQAMDQEKLLRSNNQTGAWRSSEQHEHSDVATALWH